MNIQQEIVEKIKPTMTNRQRISKLSNKDLAKFLTYVLPNIVQKYPDPVIGIEHWLIETDPGQLYRNLMRDWK